MNRADRLGGQSWCPGLGGKGPEEPRLTRQAQWGGLRGRSSKLLASPCWLTTGMGLQSSPEPVGLSWPLDLAGCVAGQYSGQRGRPQSRRSALPAEALLVPPGRAHLPPWSAGTFPRPGRFCRRWLSGCGRTQATDFEGGSFSTGTSKGQTKRLGSAGSTVFALAPAATFLILTVETSPLRCSIQGPGREGRLEPGAGGGWPWRVWPFGLSLLCGRGRPGVLSARAHLAGRHLSSSCDGIHREHRIHRR